MSKTAARLCLTCALVGLVASTAAAYVHYHLLFDPRYTSFCDVNATFSCSQVYLSRFGTAFGVPVAVFGAVWFTLTVVIASLGLAGPPSVRESIPGYLFVMSTLALAMVLYLGYASVVLLKTYCVLCLITYAAVVGLFLVSGAATAFPMTTLPRRAARDLRLLVASPLAIAIAVLFVGAAASTLAFFPREGTPGSPPVSPVSPVSQDQRSDLERFMATSPRLPIFIPADGAKVVIVKFNDYQCPACGQSYLSYKPILAKYEAQFPGAVKLVLKDYPLNPACNPNVGLVHGAACEAAVAVRLARMNGHGESMEEWLYTHQPSLTPAIVRQAAHDIGGVNDFDAKYASTIELVKGDVGFGKQLNIKSTPTFFVDGVRFEGVVRPELFDEAIAYELKRSAGKP
jgi:vitamin-K-epoxide reductase (warfarin-sensitive)